MGDLITPEDVELENKRRQIITCNGKYKYLFQMQTQKIYFYDPTYDLHGEYIKDKDYTGIRMHVRPNPDDDIYLYPGINIIAAQTGHGKSLVANNVAYQAVTEGKNVMFISLEIVKKKIFYQMLSIHSRITDVRETDWISHSDIKKHKLTPQQEKHAFDELWKSFNELKGNLYVVDEWDFDCTSITSLQELMFLVEEYAQTHTGHGLDLIIIDYVQLFKKHVESGTKNEYEAISIWVNDLRRISRNFLGQNHEIVMLLTSQLNRDAMEDYNKRAKREAQNSVLPSGKQKSIPNVTIGLNQIAGSVEICKAAETIIAIYSNEEYKASHQCSYVVLKQRDDRCSEDGYLTFMDPKYYCFGMIEKFDNTYTGDIDALFNGTYYTSNMDLCNSNNGLPVEFVPYK